MRPNYILIIVEAVTDANEVRKSLNGLRGGSPNFFKKITSGILNPIYFSIIRKPITIEKDGFKRTYRGAVGAMQLYSYLGKPDEIGSLLKEIYNLFKEFKDNPVNWTSSMTDFKIILGKSDTEIIEEDLEGD